MLSNIASNGKARFGPESVIKSPTFVEEYFKLDTFDNYSEENCVYSIPIKMSEILPGLTGEDNRQLLKTWVNLRSNPVLNSLKNKFIVFKLDYTDCLGDLKASSIKKLWETLEMEIDGSLLTENPGEESKGDGKKVELVSIVTKMKKDSGNNNQVIMQIDGVWHMFKTLINLSTKYSTIQYENANKQYYPLLLVYKVPGNFEGKKVESDAIFKSTKGQKSEKDEKRSAAPPSAAKESGHRPNRPQGSNARPGTCKLLKF